jgi:hypothetical protein
MSALGRALMGRSGWEADIDFGFRWLKSSKVLPMLSTLALAATSAASAGPNQVEFAHALQEFTGKSVSISDLRKLSCKRIEEEPTEAACKWQQRLGTTWTRFSTYVAVDGSGWHLIDEPYRVR